MLLPEWEVSIIHHHLSILYTSILLHPAYTYAFIPPPMSDIEQQLMDERHAVFPPLWTLS